MTSIPVNFDSLQCTGLTKNGSLYSLTDCKCSDGSAPAEVAGATETVRMDRLADKMTCG